MIVVTISFVLILRRTVINELQNLKYLPRSTMERELLIEDRTPAHADHVGFGPDRMTTAAVGKLQFSTYHKKI